MTRIQFYRASRLKRRRATADEMEERAAFLINYAVEHGPVTVRGLYYQAEVHGVPGIDKTDSSYDKIQRQVLNLRREGRLDYNDIADSTRWMRKPVTHDSVEDALNETARTYRKSLWRDNDARVEIWAEKDAVASVLFEITSKYDVGLMVARGFSSETFCFEAVSPMNLAKTRAVIFSNHGPRLRINTSAINYVTNHAAKTNLLSSRRNGPTSRR